MAGCDCCCTTSPRSPPFTTCWPPAHTHTLLTCSYACRYAGMPVPCTRAALSPSPFDLGAPLQVLKAAWGSPPILDSWVSGADPCSGTFIGISCASGAIVELDLSDLLLTGTIPQAITELTFLKRLALQGNFFNGSVPDFLSVGGR